MEISTQPEVSVILTTYNRADKLLPRAIESVLAQTIRDFELIIVDDCSSDNTATLVKRYTESDSRVKFVQLQENFGSDTRGKNVGALHANGLYLAYLDDDCEFHPYHLEILLKHLKEKQLDFVYCDSWIYDDDRPQWQGNQAISLPHDSQFLLNRNYIDTSQVLHKKELIFSVGGFNEELPKFIDWNCWVRMMKWGAKMGRVPVIATNYYVHSNKNNPHKSQRVETESWYDEELGMTMFKPTFDPAGCLIHGDWLTKLNPYAQRPSEVNPKVAVYTLSYDRLEYTKRMYTSMVDSTKYPFEWFVWDNGSTDGSYEYLLDLTKEDKVTSLTHSQKNEGITKASNGLLDKIKKNADYQIIIKIDNDVEFMTKQWLETLIDIWKRNHMVYISPYPEGLVDNPGGAPRVGHSFIGPYFVEVTYHIGGMFAMIDAKAYDNFRWQDKFLHGNQDREASIFFTKMGYMPCYLPLHRVSHMDTTSGQHQKYPEYFKRRVTEKTTQV